MKFLLVILQSFLVLTGASSPEELDETVVERFDYFSRHPLKINCVPASRLLESGLLSSYQVAALEDYRSRCGDVLSVAELAAVDGFGPKYAAALREYVSFESRSLPGAARRDSVLISHNLVAKAMARTSYEYPAGGVKYDLTVGDRFEFAWSSRNTYSEPKLTPGNFSAAWNGRGTLSRVIVGDYGLRFGQGLLLWSGFSMAGVNSAQVLSRTASGAYLSHSFSKMHHGASAEFSLGRWTAVTALSVSDALSDVLPVVNVKRRSGTWDAGMTAIWTKGAPGLSFDFRKGLGGLSIFGEAAWCRALSAVAGVVIVPKYGWTVTAQARYIPSGCSSEYSSPFSSTGRKNDECGLSAAVQANSFMFSMDASARPSNWTRRYRALALFSREFSVSAGSSLEPGLRFSFLYKPSEKLSYKEDLRADLKWTCGPWTAAARYNALWCRDYAWLCYVEGGYSSKLSCFIRASVFKVDNWDDRIYCYERDAPGTFNSIPMYGRGWNTSCVMSWKISRAHTLYLRAFGMYYPWMRDKSGWSEIRLQYKFTFSCRREYQSSDRPS